MSALTKAQSLFAERFSELVLVMISYGYDVAYSDGYRNAACNAAVGGHQSSLHMLRLAHDLILRDRETGKVLGEEHHLQFHLIFEEMGGNEMIEGDSGHYSWPWGTVR